MEADAGPGHGRQGAAARHVETRGNVDSAFRSAAKTVTQTYKYHYNGHAVIGPSVAVADVKKDSAVIYTNTQQLINIGTAVATTARDAGQERAGVLLRGLGVVRRAADAVRHRPDGRGALAGVGKPVRLQLMRWDENGWDLFGPAQLMDLRGGIDASGKIVAYDFVSLSQPPSNFPTTRELLGEPIPAPGTAGPNTENTAAAYAIQNKRVTGKTLPVFEGYLKRANLRNPQGPQTAFAAEQMIDELAYAAGMDAVAFRRQNITDERWLGGPERGRAGCELAAARGRLEPLERQRRHGPRRRVRPARQLGLLGDHRRDRGEQEDGQDRRQAPLQRHGRRPRRSARRWSRTR